MSAIDLLVEAKIKDWDRRRTGGATENRADTVNTTGYKSFESYLMSDIRELLDRALQCCGDEEAAERELLLNRAWELEMQMLSSLEKQGYYHLSKSFADSLRDYKNELNLAQL